MVASMVGDWCMVFRSCKRRCIGGFWALRLIVWHALVFFAWVFGPNCSKCLAGTCYFCCALIPGTVSHHGRDFLSIAGVCFSEQATRMVKGEGVYLLPPCLSITAQGLPDVLWAWKQKIGAVSRDGDFALGSTFTTGLIGMGYGAIAGWEAGACVGALL